MSSHQVVLGLSFMKGQSLEDLKVINPSLEAKDLLTILGKQVDEGLLGAYDLKGILFYIKVDPPKPSRALDHHSV